MDNIEELIWNKVTTMHIRTYVTNTDPSIEIKIHDSVEREVDSKVWFNNGEVVDLDLRIK